MSTPSKHTREVERKQLQRWLAQDRRAVPVVNTHARAVGAFCAWLEAGGVTSIAATGSTTSAAPSPPRP
jgi:hypothetical protein